MPRVSQIKNILTPGVGSVNVPCVIQFYAWETFVGRRYHRRNTTFHSWTSSIFFTTSFLIFDVMYKKLKGAPLLRVPLCRTPHFTLHVSARIDGGTLPLDNVYYSARSTSQYQDVTWENGDPSDLMSNIHPVLLPVSSWLHLLRRSGRAVKKTGQVNGSLGLVLFQIFRKFSLLLLGKSQNLYVVTLRKVF